MPSTISAGTSAGTALNITSDTTGNLAFQTNNGVTALTIDTSQNVTFANNVTYTGTITATAGFSGNGAGLTAINASNVSSGTLASARLPTSGVNASTITAGTLAVANGGTGLTSTPSNGQLDIGNGSGFTRANLTAGSGISITNGAGSISIASTSTGLPGSQGQVFTSNGTFTIPTGITALKITVVGGGGGGGGTNSAGGGGAAGGGAIAFLTGLTAGNTLSVTIGSGGGVNSNGGNSTVTSGTQSISTITGSGGGGGNNGATSGSPGVGSGGSINSRGGWGEWDSSVNGAFGGNSLFGGGGRRTTGTLGGGGGGAYITGCCWTQGQSGGNGIVVFEW